MLNKKTVLAVAISKQYLHITLALLFLIVSTKVVFSQQIQELNYQLNYTSNFSPKFSGAKPYLLDSAIFYQDLIPTKPKKKLSKALFHSNVFSYNNNAGVNFSVNPLFNFEGGYDKAAGLFADTLLYTNTRGFKVEGNLGEKFTFYTSFYENQSRYATYVNNLVSSSRASIGMGRVKTFKNVAWDYALASGMIVFKARENLQFWFGHGKNFIGEGYRSLFLSDNSSNYPHLKTSWTLANNKLNYTLILASLSGSQRFASFATGEPSLYRKGATFSYLSYAPSEKLVVSLFESTVWQRVKNGKQTPIQALQFNPLPLLNSASQGLAGNNNASLGLAINYKTPLGLSIYSQALVDDKNKVGFQVGIAKKNLFIKNLFAQVELNVVSKNTYLQTDSLTNYSHYNQALAHPMGANFQEMLLNVNYRYKRIVADLRCNVAKVNNYGQNGQNIQLAATTQANTNPFDYSCLQPSLAYIVNPSTNMQVRAGAIIRNLSAGGVSQKTNYLYLAFSTSLTNLYFDF